MSEASSRPLACLDANIFLAVLIPEATRAPKDETAGSASVLKAVEEGRLRGISTAILLGEIRYVYLREKDKAGFEIARAAIEAESNPRVLTITASWPFTPPSCGGSTIQRRMLFRTTTAFT
jgi:predicted nucleic acid-binding protein